MTVFSNLIDTFLSHPAHERPPMTPHRYITTSAHGGTKVASPLPNSNLFLGYQSRFALAA